MIMMKTTVATIGVLALLAGGAFAGPAPNDVGVTGMGGGVYYNPYKSGDSSQSVNHKQVSNTGTATESGGVHHATIDGHG